MPNVAPALERAIALWERTPYESGQRFAKRGADCLGAVFGVVDEMDGRSRARFPEFPHDIAMHQPETARSAVRTLLRVYVPCEKIEQDPFTRHFHVEPGDVLVTGERGGGPGHVMLVGPRKNTLWHAIPHIGFHQGGWSLFRRSLLFGAYRLMDKERWA
jgi:hypothetical protein